MISPFSVTAAGRAGCPAFITQSNGRTGIRQSAESFLLLAHLSGDVVAKLPLDLLLGLGIEVGYIEEPANFDHFVILSGDARGPLQRLFARLPLDDPEASDHFLRFGKRAVGNSRFSAFEGDAPAHRRGRC